MKIQEVILRRWTDGSRGGRRPTSSGLVVDRCGIGAVAMKQMDMMVCEIGCVVECPRSGCRLGTAEAVLSLFQEQYFDFNVRRFHAIILLGIMLRSIGLDLTA